MINYLKTNRRDKTLYYSHSTVQRSYCFKYIWLRTFSKMKILNPFALVSYFESTENTVIFSVHGILLVSAVECKLRALLIITTCFTYSVAGRVYLLPSTSQSSSDTTY